MKNQKLISFLIKVAISVLSAIAGYITGDSGFIDNVM